MYDWNIFILFTYLFIYLLNCEFGVSLTAYLGGQLMLFYMHLDIDYNKQKNSDVTELFCVTLRKITQLENNQILTVFDEMCSLCY